MDTREPKYPLQTLSKALEVLEHMRQSGAPLTLSAISKSLEISKSSAHRILDTLLHYGFVEKNGTAAVHYQLSWSVYQIGKVVPECHTLESYDYRSLVDFLAREVQCRVDIYIQTENTNTSLYHAPCLTDESRQSVFVERFPLYATASGKLFMLDFTKEGILRYFQTTDIRRYTPNTILNYIDFLENLEKIQEQGYSMDDREYSMDKTNVAMPVRNYNGQTVAALSITLDPDGAPAKLPELLPKLARACDTISAYLGYMKPKSL